MTDPECPVIGCGAVASGTALSGGPPMKCAGWGSTDPRCMGNWLSIDPEDAGTYAQYLAHEAEECDSDCPYAVEHASRRHRAGECDPMTCIFPHLPEERR